MLTEDTKTTLVKYVERVGDHVANLGDTVVLMVRGGDLRHEVSTGGSLRAVPDNQRN
jgi:phosphate uptake regulator